MAGLATPVRSTFGVQSSVSMVKSGPSQSLSMVAKSP